MLLGTAAPIGGEKGDCITCKPADRSRVCFAEGCRCALQADTETFCTSVLHC